MLDFNQQPFCFAANTSWMFATAFLLFQIDMRLRRVIDELRRVRRWAENLDDDC